jgi:hypothetical protein
VIRVQGYGGERMDVGVAGDGAEGRGGAAEEIARLKSRIGELAREIADVYIRDRRPDARVIQPLDDEMERLKARRRTLEPPRDDDLEFRPGFWRAPLDRD